MNTNETAVWFNKHQKDRHLYYDFISKNSVEPPRLNSANLILSGKNPLILVVTYYPSKCRFQGGAWYSMMALTTSLITLRNPIYQGNINKEYTSVELIIKKSIFSSQRKVIIIGKDFKHTIKCSRVELTESREYMKKNDEWVLEEKHHFKPLTKKEKREMKERWDKENVTFWKKLRLIFKRIYSKA